MNRMQTKTMQPADEEVRHDERECYIILRKRFGVNHNPHLEADTKVDALLHTMSMSREITSVRYFQGMYVIDNEKPVQVSDGIYCTVEEFKERDDGELQSIRLKLSSNTKNVTDIRNFIEECNNMYTLSIANKLGDSLFVFEQAAPKNSPLDPRGPPDGMPQLAIPQVQSAHLQFTKNHFQSNRNLSNVFFIGQETVKRRVNHFISNKGWYDKKGIPYTLGFLFYGVPGCGKTSSIKAIANETGRHIINIKLENIKTKTQLHNLFFNDQLHVMDEQDNYNKTETYKIPITKRLYVIEDIDCMSDIVMDRGIKADIADKEKEAKNERTRVQLETDRRPRLNPNGMFAPNELVTPMYGANLIEDDPWLSTKSSSAPAPKQDDQLTLASLLNVLDGEGLVC